MDIRPLHDRITVRRLDEGEHVWVGIIIADSASERPGEAQSSPGPLEKRCVAKGLVNDAGRRTSSTSRRTCDPVREVLGPVREDEVLGIMAGAATATNKS